MRKRSTVTGRDSRKKEKGKRKKDGRQSTLAFYLFTFSFPRDRRGFTLLELMIVITIIIILASIALPQYQKTIAQAREAVLREDLFKLRSMIDQYAADKGKLPSSLDELVSSGYMREIPVDPFTDQKDWTVTTGDDPNSSGGEQGMTDIHSASAEVSSSGTPYSEW